ncbi:hypothetical protein AA18889_0428 [Acetobacter senegalensis DSM 18889]|nr:hypothetical protein AA18889_0428 [Acetobacter senegalensis DSM 18889]
MQRRILFLHRKNLTQKLWQPNMERRVKGMLVNRRGYLLRQLALKQQAQGRQQTNKHPPHHLRQMHKVLLRRRKPKLHLAERKGTLLRLHSQPKAARNQSQQHQFLPRILLRQVKRRRLIQKHPLCHMVA